MTCTQTSTDNNNQLLLVSLLQDSRVPQEEMLRRYPALIGNMIALFKGHPTGPCYLEVWPPALESYFIAYGTFFHRHFNTHTTTLRELYLLTGMQTSVCDNSSYTQAFAIQMAASSGKTSEEKIVGLVAKNRALFSAHENLVLDVVEALCKPRSDLTKQKKDKLVAAFGAHSEHLVFTVLGSTFMNKFTDAIAVELEQRVADIAAGTIGKYGWTPGIHGWLLDPTTEPKPYPARETFAEHIRRLRFLPAVISFLLKAEGGVPSKWSKMEPFLTTTLGHGFPLLQHVQNPTLRKGMAALLVRNLDPQTSVCGLSVKCLAAMMFAAFEESDTMEKAVCDMALKFEVSEADLQQARAYACDERLFCEFFRNKQVRAMLGLFKAVLPTPCQVTPPVVDFVREANVSGSIIVELVVWASSLKMLHRLSCYYLV